MIKPHIAIFKETGEKVIVLGTISYPCEGGSQRDYILIAHKDREDEESRRYIEVRPERFKTKYRWHTNI